VAPCAAVAGFRKRPDLNGLRIDDGAQSRERVSRRRRELVSALLARDRLDERHDVEPDKDRWTDRDLAP